MLCIYLVYYLNLEISLISRFEQRFSQGAWPYLLMIGGAFIISTNHVLGRYVGGEIPPMGLAFWRVTIGAIILLPFAWNDIFRQRFIILNNWKLLFVMAIAFMPLGNAMVYLGYNFTTAINGGIIATAQPATTVLLAWLILRQKINLTQFFGVGTAAIGVLIIITKGNPLGLATITFNNGDLLLLIGITAFSFYSVMLRQVPSSISPMLILVVIQIMGAISLLPFYIYESLTYKTVPLNIEALMVLAWIGVVIAVIAVGMTNMSVLALGPAKASIGHYLRAVFTAGMAIIILGETMELYHLISVGIVIIGVIFMSRGQSPMQRS